MSITLIRGLTQTKPLLTVSDLVRGGAYRVVKYAANADLVGGIVIGTGPVQTANAVVSYGVTIAVHGDNGYLGSRWNAQDTSARFEEVDIEVHA